ncbi:MAG: STAS domain-containing protein [Gaiellales bacterium]
MDEIAQIGGVSVDREHDVSVVTLSGEHDLIAAVGLTRTLESLLAPEELPLSRRALVVVDLTQATVIGTSVISALMRVHHTACNVPDRELAIVVESPERFAARVVQLVHMPWSVPTYPNRTLAVAHLLSAEIEAPRLSS